MGRKKKKKKAQQAQNRVWCFYCDREFANEKVLIEHQGNKHLKCTLCYKKASTATGLVVHMENVHKETIKL